MHDKDSKRKCLEAYLTVFLKFSIYFVLVQLYWRSLSIYPRKPKKKEQKTRKTFAVNVQHNRSTYLKKKQHCMAFSFDDYVFLKG